MKKRIFKLIKKQWLLIWTMIVSVAMLSIVVFAEYPGTKNTMKRVVVSDESADLLFTSNLLTLFENDRISYQPCYFKPKEEFQYGTYDVDVYLWNYSINGSGDYYKKNIDYILEISVVDSRGNVLTGMESGKTIQITEGDGSTQVVAFSSSSSSYTYITGTKTIAANGRSQNKYTIKFSYNWDLDSDSGIRVMMKATPTPAASFKDLKPLAASIGLREEKGSDSAGWRYYISEQRLAGSPSDYDAYNLVLTGTGSSEIIIEWDPTKIAVNKDFYEHNGAYSFANGEVVYTQNGGTNNWDRLVINADSYSQDKGNRNRYDLQLYKYDGEVSGSWNFVGSTTGTGVCMTITGAEAITQN